MVVQVCNAECRLIFKKQTTPEPWSTPGKNILGGAKNADVGDIIGDSSFEGFSPEFIKEMKEMASSQPQQNISIGVNSTNLKVRGKIVGGDYYQGDAVTTRAEKIEAMMMRFVEKGADFDKAMELAERLYDNANK